MATDEFISYDEAFELLCENAGVKGLGIQVQPGTMYSYGYDPYAEMSHTDDEQQQHRRIRKWLKEIGFTGQKFPVAEFERLAELFPDGVARQAESAAVGGRGLMLRGPPKVTRCRLAVRNQLIIRRPRTGIAWPGDLHVEQRTAWRASI